MSQPLPKITFYDVTSTLSPKSSSPNATRSWSPFTIRTLLSLRHRRIPYERKALSYPDISPFLASKNVPPYPNAKETTHTLPAISVHKDGEEEITLMDSLPIAHYLENLIPACETHPSLFPQGAEVAEQQLQKFKAVLGEAAGLVELFVFPAVPGILDQRGRDYFVRTREEAWGRTLESMAEEGEAQEGGFDEAVRGGFKVLAGFYVEEEREGRKGEGVFVGGGVTPSYVDFAVVGCIEWWRCAKGEDVIDRVMEEVEGGVLARVVKGCEHLLY